MFESIRILHFLTRPHITWNFAYAPIYLGYSWYLPIKLILIRTLSIENDPCMDDFPIFTYFHPLNRGYRLPRIFFSVSRFFSRPSALRQKTPPTCRRLRKTFCAGKCSRLNPLWKNHRKCMRQIKGSFGVWLWFIFGTFEVYLYSRYSFRMFPVLISGWFGVYLGLA
jgi:hypothetical protein